MGALAQIERTATRRLAEPYASPARPVPAGRRRPKPQRRPDWNVLAEELVPFPPAATGNSSTVDPGEQGWCEGTRFAEPALVPSPARLAPRPQASVRHRRVTARPRGLRRLLPGAATLAVLASVWLGIGALAGVHRPALSVPASAVKVHGGYIYTARPGDTLWSIASGLEPGGDPRPLVAQLEQQLHGAQLIPGDELRVP